MSCAGNTRFGIISWHYRKQKPVQQNRQPVITDITGQAVRKAGTQLRNRLILNDEKQGSQQIFFIFDSAPQPVTRIYLPLMAKYLPFANIHGV
jgi:hypothetical protein